MSRRYFEQMLEELELANLSSQYRWYASLNPMCYALPEMQYDFRNVSRLNRHDLFPVNYFRQPYWMSQGIVFPNYDPFSLLRRNDKRGFHGRDNNFSREKRTNGEKRFYPNRKHENNNFRMDRNGKKIDFMPQHERRYQNTWKGEVAQHYHQLSREGARNASRLSFRDASIDTCVEDILNDQHFQNLKQVFENRNASTNCLNLNENMNQVAGTSANGNGMNIDSSEAVNYHKMSEFDWPDLNSKSTQNYPSDTQYTEPAGVTNSYASWYCPEEQQQIVDMLKEVDMRHERQLQRDILLSRGEQPSSDESSSNNNSQSVEAQQRSSQSSDEDEDSINIILYSESCSGIPAVSTEEIESGYHEKSASDFFDEFQNIFTGSPEKKIINTLTKESLKNTSNNQNISEEDKKVITEDDKNAVKAVLNFEITDDVSENTFSECSNIVSSSPKEHSDKMLSDQNISRFPDRETSVIKEFSNVSTSNAPVLDLCKSTKICAESSTKPKLTSKTTAGSTVSDTITKNSSENKCSFRTSEPENISCRENENSTNGRNFCKNSKMYQPKKFLKTENSPFLQRAIGKESNSKSISQQYNSNVTHPVENYINQDNVIRSNDNTSMKLFDSENHSYSNKYIKENGKTPSSSEPMLSKSNGFVYKRVSISEIFNSINSSYKKGFVRLPDKNHETYLRNQYLKPSHLSPSEHLKQILGIGQKFSSTNILHKNMKNLQPGLCDAKLATSFSTKSPNPKLANISQINDITTSTKCSSSKTLNADKTTKAVKKEINEEQHGIRSETVELNQKANNNIFVDKYCTEQNNLKKENNLNTNHCQFSDCKRNFHYSNYSQSLKQDSYWKRNKYYSQHESQQLKKYNNKPTEEAKSKCCEKTLEQDLHFSEVNHLQHIAEANTKKDSLQENLKLRKQESTKYGKLKKYAKGVEIFEATDSNLLLKEETSQKDNHSFNTPTPETSKAKKKFKKKQKTRLSDESRDKQLETRSKNSSDNKHYSQECNIDFKNASETYHQIGRQLNSSSDKQNIPFSKTKNSTGPKDTENLKTLNADIKREHSQVLNEKKHDAICHKKNIINKIKDSIDKLDTKTFSPEEVFKNEAENRRIRDKHSTIKDEFPKKDYFNERKGQFREENRYWRRKNNRVNQYYNTKKESKPETLKIANLKSNEHSKITTEDDKQNISKNTELKNNNHQKELGKDSSENAVTDIQNKFDNDNKMDRKENTLIANNYKARSKEKTNNIISNRSKFSETVELNKNKQCQDIADEYNQNIADEKTKRQLDYDKLHIGNTVQSTRCRNTQSKTDKDISSSKTTSISKPENVFFRAKENSSEAATSFRPETFNVKTTKTNNSRNYLGASSTSVDGNYIPVDYLFLNMSHCRCIGEKMMEQAGRIDHLARKRKFSLDSLNELINKRKTCKDFLVLFVDENGAHELQQKGKFRFITSSKSLIKKNNCFARRDNSSGKCVLCTIDEENKLFIQNANNYVDNMKILTKSCSTSNSFGKCHMECNGDHMLSDTLKNIVILVSPRVMDKCLRIEPSLVVFIPKQISDILHHLHSAKSSEDLQKCLQLSLNILNNGHFLHRLVDFLLVLSVIHMKWNRDDIRELLRFTCHNNKNRKQKFFRSQKEILDVDINEILHWWGTLSRYIEDRKN